MKQRLEVHMIEPVSHLMREKMKLEIVDREFSAGYGIADLVGGTMSKKNCMIRNLMGLKKPIDHHHLIEVFLALKSGTRHLIKSLLNRISFSESTLRKKVLPKMATLGLIEREANDYIRLLKIPPNPTERIVAVEVKQTKWREAIIQARRYTFFADQTYIAVWNGTVNNVDKTILNKHQIGLIGVESDGAEIFLEAPKREPRNPEMNRYCSEFLYGKIINI